MYYCWKCVLSVSLSLILLSTIASPVSSCWGSTSTNLGDITPDQKLLDGSPLQIDCSLNNNTIEYEGHHYQVNSSMISFKFQTAFYREDRIHLINETAARLEVEKASISDNGLYYCLLNISGLSHRPLVCLTHITVGYKPQSVKNFKCISLHYRKLHCSWTPPKNPIPTTYHLEDKYHASFEYLSRKCGNIPSENSCEWTVDTVPPYRNTALKFNLVLTGSNQFGNKSELFVVDHYSIIKPNIPKHFREIEVTATTIGLSWGPPEYIEFDDELLENIIYEIRYFSPNEKDKSQTIIVDGIHQKSHNLTDLVPFLKYNISIRCKTIESKSDEYWSDFSSILIQTKADVPYFAPKLIPELFQTDKNMDGIRSITLFWKEIPSQHENGPDFHYLIKYYDIKKRKTRAINLVNNQDSEIMVQNTTYTFIHMESSVTYAFTIFGVNSMGRSSNSSRIVVQRNDIIPHKPSNIDVYSFGGGRYEVKWTKPPENSMSGPIMNYTVFWCQNLRPRPFLCEGPVDWTPTKSTSIALELPDVGINYQFAVSANALKSSSGMSWAECIVPIDGRLEKLNEVQLKALNSNSIVVIWKLNCPAQKRIVELYKIKFCAIKGFNQTVCEKTQSLKVSNSAENYTLQGLEPFTKYQVTVLAYSVSGPSEESTPRYIVTAHGSPGKPLNLRMIGRTANSIDVLWGPPFKLNGLISHYKIECNDKIYTLRADKCNETQCLYSITNLRSYWNYQIGVIACNSDSLCSNRSDVLSVVTQMGVPNVMDPPRSEIVNSTTVRITWSPPAIQNGPIDSYFIKLIRTNNTTEIFNISGKSKEYLLSFDCNSMEETLTSNNQQFSVQIASENSVEDGSPLTALFSNSTNLNTCFGGAPNITYILGLVGGVAIGLLFLVLVLVFLVRLIKKKIYSDLNFKIYLPKGLESPVLYQMESPIFDMLARSDSFPNIGVEATDANHSINKNRHESGLSTEANTSSDSGVENDILLQNKISKNIEALNKINSNPTLPFEARPSKNSDSSDSQEDINCRSAKSKKRKSNKVRNNNMKTTTDSLDPLYDTLYPSVYNYSIMSNSEPSLLETAVREDDNVLSDLTKSSKPEMAKSLTNIIEKYSSLDSRVNCIICETNVSPVPTPYCSHSKNGIKRQYHNQNDFITNSLTEMRNAVKDKANHCHITIDSIPQSGETVALKSPMKRLDSETSTSSSNGENDDTDLMLTQNHSTKGCLSSTECPKVENKIQNTSNKDINDSSVHTMNTSSDSLIPESEPQLGAIKDNSIKRTNPVKKSATHLLKDSNGYVLHNALSQLNDNKIEPKLVISSPGYVRFETINANGAC